MPLFARLGLLNTVEISESNRTGTDFSSHSASALGMAGATASRDDYLDLCLQHCPPELMSKIMNYHLTSREPLPGPMCYQNGVLIPDYFLQLSSFRFFTQPRF